MNEDFYNPFVRTGQRVSERMTDEQMWREAERRTAANPDPETEPEYIPVAQITEDPVDWRSVRGMLQATEIGRQALEHEKTRRGIK